MLPVQDSGRPWKEPGQRAGSLRNPRLSTTWEKKMADKALAGAFREAKQESISARKEKMQVCAVLHLRYKST
jgi:rRNA-processing protein CGR1